MKTNNKKQLRFLKIFIPVLLFCSCSSINMINKNFDIANEQYRMMLDKNTNVNEIPRTTEPDGSLQKVNIKSWTSGFFAGNLWLLYEYTSDNYWRDKALEWTKALEELQYFTNHHDVGFMINCSYGNGYRMLPTKEYRDVILNAAESLSSRYNETVMSIKSWNRKKAWDGKTVWEFPVIIDNMMNLEMLFSASKLSGDNKFREIAIQHARTTIKYHYRENYSCYHVVDYDENTGKVKDRATSQGYADESAWARGQAWGLYGFTMCFRETGYEEFLDMALNIAEFLMNHPSLPDDAIPFWDYDLKNSILKPEWDYNPAEKSYDYRDVSAAAIMASAFYELSRYSPDGQKYYEFAQRIIESLSSDEYMAEAGTNNNFLLKHSVGSIPHGNEIDQPLVYADYYFLEALLRKLRIDSGQELFKINFIKDGK